MVLGPLFIPALREEEPLKWKFDAIFKGVRSQIWPRAKGCGNTRAECP